MKNHIILLITILCTLLAPNASAQRTSRTNSVKKAFSLNLNLVSSDTTKATIMWNTANPYAIIPVNFKNGIFSFASSTTSFIKVSRNDVFQISHLGKYFYVILDAPNIEVNLDHQQVKGGTMNQKLHSIFQQIQSATSQAAANKIALDAIRANKNNPIAPIILKTKMADLDYGEMQGLIVEGGSYLNNPLCANILSVVKRAPGQKIKDLELKDTLGNTHKLSEYIHKGQYTLFDFWASWCKPCLFEMPYVKANYEKYKDLGFTVVGISLDDNAALWKKSILQNDFEWIHLSDLKGWETSAQPIYGITSIPANFLCDGEGNIIATDLRKDDLNQKLTELYSNTK